MKWSEMNVKERVIGGGITGAGIVAVMMLYITPCLAQEFYEVGLKTDGDTLTANVNPGRRCEHKKHEGCMLFKEGDLGVITFYVVGTGHRPKNCNPDKRPNHKVITKVELTATLKQADGESKQADGESNATDDKGEFNPPLDESSKWLKDQAFTELNLNTGIVYEASRDKANNRLTLINYNDSDYVDKQVKQFWYKVTVTSCDEDNPKTWVTDPRGDNEGTR